MYVCVFKYGDVFTMGGGGEKDKRDWEWLLVLGTQGLCCFQGSMKYLLHRSGFLADLDWVQTARTQALFERWRAIHLLTSWGRSRAGVTGLSSHLKVKSKDEDVFSVVTVMTFCCNVRSCDRGCLPSWVCTTMTTNQLVPLAAASDACRLQPLASFWWCLFAFVFPKGPLYSRTALQVCLSRFTVNT